MKLLMISGDRSVATGKPGAFTETLRELSPHFERIDILCPRATGEKCVETIFGNVFLHPAPGGLLSQPRFILRRGKELHSLHHYDTLTVHDYPPFYNGLGARRLMKSTGIPAVLEIHHIVGWPRAASLTELLGRVLSRLILPSHCKLFRAVRVVNTTVQNLLMSWGVPEEKISAVPSFYLDHERINACRNQAKKYDLVFCGRFVDNKRLLPVIAALEHLPTASLLVIGDGPMRAKAEEMAKTFGPRVTFVGWLPTQDDVLRSIASGKIFIMNSASEGGPRAALEAMALGLPILTTRVGILPDIVKEGVNGVFTDGTAPDIAEKAGALLRDSEKMHAMGQEATKVMERFEKKTAVRAYAEFLEGVGDPSLLSV